MKNGENIVQIAAICRKLETEREKIIPFGKKKKLFDKSDSDLRKPPEDFKENTMSILADMENFWIRYNNARLDCACLAEEKANLKEENRDLKEKLKMYLTNVTIADGSGGNVRDKLRPSSMKVERMIHVDLSSFHRDRKPRPVTCIEGNLSNAVRSRSLVERKLKMPSIFTIINN